MESGKGSLANMRILFTGASSFTGFWFAKALAEEGHAVTATFQKGKEDYASLRHDRLSILEPFVNAFYHCSFGSPSFLELLDEPWDVFCHHGAYVENYKSLDFPVLEAVSANTREARKVVEKLKSNGCSHIVLTGSIFEQNEGMGTDRLPAFSPYALSKAMTAEIFKFEARLCHLPLKKFVIPNPFGPYEEPRFLHYLINSWKENKTASVQTPAYIRDNIPISLLTKAYVQFVQTSSHDTFTSFHPSFYVESQGAFTERVAKEMRKHLQLPCSFTLASQTVFPEPRIRFNTSFLSPSYYNWDEEEFWKEYALFYEGAPAK